MKLNISSQTRVKSHMKRSLRNRSYRKSAAGFTLFEMIIVLTIISLLAGFVIFQLAGYLSLGKDTKTADDIIAFKTDLALYQLQNHSLPTTEQGLDALWSRPTVEPVPSHWIKTMDSQVLDPWNNPYQYDRPGKHNPDSFDVYSMGPDGKPNTADDIGNWK